MRYREIITLLNDPEIKQLYSTGTNGAIKLEPDELQILESLHSRLTPAITSTTNIGVWNAMTQIAAGKAIELVNGSDKPVIGTSKGNIVHSVFMLCSPG
ncbi:unnamed protein product [Gongylonema pulchrum]|uniref:Caprin-1_dimer domain-containing protein n=1 Tax=Gongylonema pulchrum TaxID=637853 RepID=A0A183D451_9BILA|nr:unnamed protein product [Gongylonema pulchrum]